MYTPTEPGTFFYFYYVIHAIILIDMDVYKFFYKKGKNKILKLKITK